MPLDDKLDFILLQTNLAGFKEQIPAHELEGIIARHWGHNPATIKTALRYLIMFQRVRKVSPKVYQIIPEAPDD